MLDVGQCGDERACPVSVTRDGVCTQRAGDERDAAPAGDDADAHWALLVSHRSRLEGFVGRLIGDVHAAEDVVAEAFLTAWRRKDEMPREGRRAVAWLYGAAANIARNHARGEVRRRRLIERAARDVDTQDGARLVPGIDRLAATDVWTGLSDAERKLLALVARGASHRQVAAVLDTAPGAVAMRLLRARVKLSAGLRD